MLKVETRGQREGIVKPNGLSQIRVRKPDSDSTFAVHKCIFYFQDISAYPIKVSTNNNNNFYFID